MREKFDRVCICMIFFLLAFLLLFGGIRVAGGLIEFAQAQQIQIVNGLVESLKTDSESQLQNKKVQDISYKYLKAFLVAMAEFQFLPRNDFAILAAVINAVPQETEVLSFSYSGRDLTVRTTQTSSEPVELMAKELEEEGTFANVVYSYYIDNQNNYVAEITLVASHYEGG